MSTDDYVETFIKEHENHIDLAIKILTQTKEISNLKSFLSLIQFIYKHAITDIPKESTCLASLHKTLAVNVLAQSNPQIKSTLLHLLDKGWTFEQLHHLSDKGKELFITIAQYKIPPTFFDKIRIILNKPPEEWLKEINLIAVKHLFASTERLYTSEITDKINAHPCTQWDTQGIQNWAQKPNLSDHIEVLAVMKRANYLITGYNLTDVQIMSCWTALNKRKGILLQIATGEGKSTIVCILAIINALAGKKVDVVTSSPILAARDAKEKAKLYALFGLTCGDNNDVGIYTKDLKDCYNKHVVYGEAAQFQFDILRDEYSNLNTRAKRTCECMIIDEVDMMLIDDNAKIARLASSMAGFDLLQVIYHYIWQRFQLLVQEDIDLSKDPEAFVKDHLKKYINILIVKEQIQIPLHLREFIDTQLTKWIDSAILAFKYQKNVHYVVHEGMIKPVDFESTGIVQSCTHWNNGLHQFLQIKHHLKLTCESLTTNFLSNIGFFKRYGNNLYGLTGTLGSLKAQHILQDVYNVDLHIMPRSRSKRFVELDPIIMPNETKWFEEICDAAKREVKKERGVLIVTKTIEQSQHIEQKLRKKYATELYTMNNMDQEKQIEKITPQKIFVATLLAGRGVDIKTDAIEPFGGMHVILTFMPENQRVEDQIYGRTARQGHCGTAQMILNAHEMVDRNKRDQEEAKQLDAFVQKDLKMIETKDKLFKEFCTMLQSLRTLMHKKSAVYVTNTLLDVEEQWAMFLGKIDDGIISIKDAASKFKTFAEDIVQRYEREALIKNPYHYIAIAYDLLTHTTWYSDQTKLADTYFDKAITLDTDMAATAHVGKAWIALKKQNSGYKQKARTHLERGLESVATEKSALEALCKLEEGDLSKQIIQKINILGSYANTLYSAIQTIKSSLRLMRLSARKNDVIQVCAGVEKHTYTDKLRTLKGSHYEVTFNGLTLRQDMGDHDQAIETIAATGVSKNISIKVLHCKSETQLPSRKMNATFKNQKTTDLFDTINADSITLTGDLKHEKKLVIVNGDKQKVRVEHLTKEQAKTLMKTCAHCHITFVGVDKNPLKEEQFADISYENLTKQEAHSLIQQLRKQNLEFKLKFHDMSYADAEKLIAKASIDQEKVQISHVKRTEDLFMNESKPYLELLEFSARGIEYLLEINEKRFIPWRSVVTVTMLGCVQAGAGAALICTGFGASAGMGLISEGVSDMITAGRTLHTRQFSWKDYGKQKAVSLAISVASAGLKSLKNAGKGVKSLTQKNAVLSNTGQVTALNGGQSITQNAFTSGNNLKHLAAKQLGISLGEAVARETLNGVVDDIMHFSLEQFKTHISSSIQTKVEDRFLKDPLKQMIQRVQAGTIEKMVVDIINPEHAFWRKQWQSIGLPLCQGILGDKKILKTRVSILIRIAGTIQGSAEICFIIDTVFEQSSKNLHLTTIRRRLNYDLSMLMKFVSDRITDQILKITESQLISPWSSFGVGFVTDKMSQALQDKMIKKQLKQELLELEQMIESLEKKEGKSAEEHNKLSKLKTDHAEKHSLMYEKQSYRKLIDHEADKYMIAYSQSEIIHNATASDSLMQKSAQRWRRSQTITNMAIKIVDKDYKPTEGR